MTQQGELKEVFWTVYTRTKAGVERPVFTFAKTATEAGEKVKKHFADEHSKLLEQCSTDEERADVGPASLMEVTGVAWRDTFIP